jgi:hypothetical protein
MNMRIAALIASAMLALAGCQKAADVPKPVTSDAGTSAPTASASVAVPPAALPPSDAAIKPADPAAPAASGDAQNTPTQTRPTNLSKAEEQGTMPHSGQVNNHSTPETTEPRK